MNRDTTWNHLGTPTRRALLGSTAGALSLLAGCGGGGGGDDDGTQTAPAGSGGDGRTLTWFTRTPIEYLTWLGTTPAPGPEGRYFRPSTKMAYQMTMQPSILMGQRGEPIVEGYESIDKTPSKVTYTIRDDWNWSNGDPVTAGDALAIPLAFAVAAKVNQNASEPPEQLEMGSFHSRISGYEIEDEKTFSFLSEDGGFEPLGMEEVYAPVTMSGGDPWGGIRQNVKMEPYTGWWEEIQAQWETAKGGDWSPDDWEVETAFAPALFGDEGYSNDPAEDDYDDYWEKEFQKPENVVVQGAWKPDQINGTQDLELVPNEEYYDREAINFDRIKVVRRRSGNIQQLDRASRVAMKANSQHYYRGDVPDHIVEAFDEAYEERLVPAPGGLGYAVSHAHGVLGDHRVRRAIVHAIDAERLMTSVHERKFREVSVPGAHAWGSGEILGEDWVANTLTDYGEPDTDRASELMQAAGYTKDGDRWKDGDGNEASIEIPTAKRNPNLAPPLATHLTDFGFEASFQTYNGGVFEEQKENGDFPLWPTNRGLGFHSSAVGRLYHSLVERQSWATDMFQVFPPEQLEQLSYDEHGSLDPVSLENVAPCTLEAPPVGEPDGDLQTWQPPRLAIVARETRSPEIRRETMRKLAWLYNWHMPVLPIAQTHIQHFLDTENWNWPAADSNPWTVAGNTPEDLLAYGGYVQKASGSESGGE